MLMKNQAGWMTGFSILYETFFWNANYFLVNFVWPWNHGPFILSTLFSYMIMNCLTLLILKTRRLSTIAGIPNRLSIGTSHSTFQSPQSRFFSNRNRCLGTRKKKSFQLTKHVKKKWQPGNKTYIGVSVEVGKILQLQNLFHKNAVC